MKKHASSRVVNSYSSYEEWCAAFLPKGDVGKLDEDIFGEPPSEVGKIIATTTLKKLSSSKINSGKAGVGRQAR